MWVLQQILNYLICVAVLRMKQKGCIILWGTEREVLENSTELSTYRSVEITLSKEYLFITDFRIIDLYQINSRF